MFQRVKDYGFGKYNLPKVGNLRKVIANNLAHSFLEFLSPTHCELCKDFIGIKLTRIRNICDKCYDTIEYAPTPDDILSMLISYFPGDELAISSIASLYQLNSSPDFSDVIYSLKYEGFSSYCFDFGKELGAYLELKGFVNYDYIIPIPIHKARFRERGYNQSDEIAKGISEIINIPVRNDIIIRNQYTKTQTTLSASERKFNVGSAFEAICEKEDIRDKKILLIDDVLTTGSTLNSCAMKLLESGARIIDAATLAHA